MTLRPVAFVVLAFACMLGAVGAGAQPASTGPSTELRTGSGQAYPVKPVRILVGYVPGGGVDTTARIMAAALTDFWGAQVIVENRPGAACPPARGCRTTAWIRSPAVPLRQWTARPVAR